MYYVYILRSKPSPQRVYVGLTKNLNVRLQQHNRGDSSYTKTYGPWGIETYVVFKHHSLAQDFEKYLKAGSGFAFLKKRLLPKL